MSEKDLERLLHNYFLQKHGGVNSYNDISVSKDVFFHLFDRQTNQLRDQNLKKYRVGLMLVCLNERYWEFAKEVIEGAKKFFLPGHEVEIMLWTDMPGPTDKEAFNRAAERLQNIYLGRLGVPSVSAQQELEIKDGVLKTTQKAIQASVIAEGVTKFYTEPVDWPYPTLMRYHLFLGQEEHLRKFDYLFYCDADMQFVNIVGDEVLSDLTAAQHPMYALRKEYWPPHEPNEQSQAYIKRPGRLIEDGGKKRFQPLYFAGGFQGGKTGIFIDAMKEMKRMIDHDLDQNYLPIWNDESVWNRLLFDHPPATVLSPSYIYPDSLINEYYIPIWGQNYQPRLITLTKKFTTDRQGAEAVRKIVTETKPLQ